MALQQRVPYLGPWTAHCYLKDRIHQVECEISPDADMDHDEHFHVASPDRHEYSQILQEDRELNKVNHWVINNRVHVDPLQFMSVFPWYSRDYGSYIKRREKIF